MLLSKRIPRFLRPVYHFRKVPFSQCLRGFLKTASVVGCRPLGNRFAIHCSRPSASPCRLPCPPGSIIPWRPCGSLVASLASVVPAPPVRRVQQWCGREPGAIRVPVRYRWFAAILRDNYRCVCESGPNHSSLFSIVSAMHWRFAADGSTLVIVKTSVEAASLADPPTEYIRLSSSTSQRS